MLFLNQKISLQNLFICGISLLLFSCISTQQLELKKNVYQSLGLKKECRDNFALYKEAASWLYVPYADASCSKSGLDCSCLVFEIYKTVYSKTIERNTSALLKNNCRKIHKHQLREGDLVFFSTSNKSNAYVNHVGIYLKHNKFIHASVSKGVIVSDLDENYYKKSWVCGGRVK